MDSVLSRPGIEFTNVRLETTNNALKVTLSPSAGGRYARQIRAYLKRSEARGSLRFVFPGKVLSSDFPETEGNATGFSFDAKSDESLDALMKLQEKPVVILAEAGELKLAEPLESRQLMRSRHALAGSNEDLPLTDAGPGFVAEALGLTIRSVYLFPEGEKSLDDSLAFVDERAGVTVNAKVFAPKGRIVLSAMNAKVLSAKDDKGREISKSESDDDEESYSYYYFSGSEPGNSTRIALQLPLPEFDAQAIDELNGEVIAVTASGWKEITIPNVQSVSTNEVDLSEILPGAKLVVKKTTSQERRIQAQVQLTGPEAISRLDLKLVLPGNAEAHSYSSNRGSSMRSDTSTRTVDVQVYTYGMDEAPPGAANLVVRYPQDLKRERVRFVLNGLDLL
ncbi:MAG TPA: hypothetical protein GYA07_05460 [Verrucomicrobia bacterium]|nr:hypothetical protein [Verrucomicrobiota bacterium]HOP96923.1 hypothetical protein [Verrucomicrobiota bacterium]